MTRRPMPRVTHAPVVGPLWLDVAEVRITPADLARTAHVHATLQAWDFTVAAAADARARAGLFTTWNARREWYYHLPSGPSLAEQAKWAKQEARQLLRDAVQAGLPMPTPAAKPPRQRRAPKPAPVISESRQLEIALAVLDRAEGCRGASPELAVS